MYYNFSFSLYYRFLVNKSCVTVCINLKKRVYGYHGYQRIFFRNRGLKIQLILKRNDALAYITLQRPYRYAYHSALCIGWTRKLRKVSLGTSEFF